MRYGPDNPAITDVEHAYPEHLDPKLSVTTTQEWLAEVHPSPDGAI